MSSPWSWYIAHVNSGSESIVKNKILSKSRDVLVDEKTNFYVENTKYDIKHFIGQEAIREILIPSTKQEVLEGDIEKITEKKVMPGYIFINMIMCDKAYMLITGIPKVISFLGGKTPTTVSQKEINNVLKAIENNAKTNEEIKINIGDNVEVLEGSLTSMNGVVTQINYTDNTASLSINIFGSPTAITLPIKDIKKT